MRLLNVDTLLFEEFAHPTNQPPSPYAILLHRWGPEGDEISFKEYKKIIVPQENVPTHTYTSRRRYTKIVNLCRLAKLHGCQWAWIDTCCIDKRSSAELTEAINSMFAWYQKAHVCFAFLRDVPARKFEHSEWWHRGWTLQELIAPQQVSFSDCNWKRIGDKRAGQMATLISRVSDIPRSVIANGETRFEYSVAQRMSWAAGRKTFRVEDEAYSLLGLFDVEMPLIYGEGTKAFRRLQQMIMEREGEETILAFSYRSPKDGAISASPPLGIFAPKPELFAPSWGTRQGNVGIVHEWRQTPPIFTIWGLKLDCDALRTRVLDQKGALVRTHYLVRLASALFLSSPNTSRQEQIPCYMALTDYLAPEQRANDETRSKHPSKSAATARRLQYFDGNRVDCFREPLPSFAHHDPRALIEEMYAARQGAQVTLTPFQEVRGMTFYVGVHL